MGALTATGGTEKAGDIKFHAASAIPAGWIKANGAAISRTAYGALFAVIGTAYGAGDGATTFNLPDLRGEFLRGWDDGRGADSGRAFGSAQAQAVQSHTHAIPDIYTSINVGSGGTISGGNDATPLAKNTIATGGPETRPRNVALLACIKY